MSQTSKAQIMENIRYWARPENSEDLWRYFFLSEVLNVDTSYLVPNLKSDLFLDLLLNWVEGLFNDTFLTEADKTNTHFDIKVDFDSNSFCGSNGPEIEIKINIDFQSEFSNIKEDNIWDTIDPNNEDDLESIYDDVELTSIVNYYIQCMWYQMDVFISLLKKLFLTNLSGHIKFSFSLNDELNLDRWLDYRRIDGDIQELSNYDIDEENAICVKENVDAFMTEQWLDMQHAQTLLQNEINSCNNSEIKGLNSLAISAFSKMVVYLFGHVYGASDVDITYINIVTNTVYAYPEDLEEIDVKPSQLKVIIGKSYFNEVEGNGYYRRARLFPILNELGSIFASVVLLDINEQPIVVKS